MKGQIKTKSKGPLRNRKLVAVLISIGTSILSYVIFGTVTAIISNGFFTRMTPFGLWEQISLIVTSLLLGTYFGLAYYGKASGKDKVCTTTAAAGGIFGFLTFGCSICNKILVFFLGVAGVFTYFEPIRPFLGIVSILFLGFAIYKKAENITAA
ncbi:MAG: hypothetical protein AABX33_02090 [Nanoarchaeota archaeon]